MRIPRPSRRSVVIALAVLTLAVAVFFLTLPDTRELSSGWPEETAFMRSWLRGQDAGATVDYRPVPLSAIPQRVRRAVLVSEDAAFYAHDGFDWHEVRAAVRKAWTERDAPRGASTITQQLARNLYLSASRNPFRKLREALITRRLEKTLSKDRILELYLNVIEFGPGVYGVEAASRRYFGTSIGSVTQREAAELAGTIPSPRRNNPATRTGPFQFRARLAYARAFGGENPDTIAIVPGAPAPDVAMGSDSVAAEEPVGDSTTVVDDLVPEPAGAPPDTVGVPTDTASRADTTSRLDTIPAPADTVTPAAVRPSLQDTMVHVAAPANGDAVQFERTE